MRGRGEDGLRGRWGRGSEDGGESEDGVEARNFPQPLPPGPLVSPSFIRSSTLTPRHLPPLTPVSTPPSADHVRSLVLPNSTFLPLLATPSRPLGPVPHCAPFRPYAPSHE